MMRRPPRCWCERAPTSTPSTATACRRCRWRARTGNAAVVKLLLAAGADANATLKGGETVLMMAARSGNLEAVKALLARGARHDARERRGQTALMWAAAEGHAAVVRALIDAGADINATLDSGFTPFFFAVREGHIDVVRALLRGGRRCERDRCSAARACRAGPSTSRRTSRPAGARARCCWRCRTATSSSRSRWSTLGADPNDRRTGFTPLHTITWVRKPDSSDVQRTRRRSGRAVSRAFSSCARS